MSEEKQFLPDIIDHNQPGSRFEITNFSEIKEALASILAQYKDFKLTDYGEAKNLRARLNNAAKAFNTKKIAVKKAYMEPYEYGENQIKELIAMIDEASLVVDSQIKEYEENLKKQKKADIEELFKTFDNPRKIPLEKIWNEKWLNAGTSIKAIEKEITAFFEKVESDIANIESLVSDEERKVMTVKLYVDCLDMGRAITEEKRVYELTHAPKPEPVSAPAQAEEPVEPTPAPVEEREELKAEVVEVFTLTIEGTRTELLEVRDFLKAKGLKFKFERK